MKNVYLGRTSVFYTVPYTGVRCGHGVPGDLSDGEWCLLHLMFPQWGLRMWEDEHWGLLSLQQQHQQQQRVSDA
ncbi:hypothetical protein ElyMa_001492600 [Elysia marginata]|uniref:Uncharacterized protein n=1 Tax=Elysia marginata TaxID=1093978 RepID=A0AAV4J3A5_9GAST|nr:hypothetical protein ElyMa_001492600 [Elysia marginata]